jgi:hypothetical protein
MTESTADVYATHSADEIAALPTVFRDDLFRDRVVLVSGGWRSACSQKRKNTLLSK